MTRSPTDTIILTGTLGTLLEDPTSLLKFLSVLRREIELISLIKFNRILLVCDSRLNSELTFKELQKWKTDQHLEFNISYSLKDNDSSRSHIDNTEIVDYLELPLEHETKRFLISPPLSPPPEWDHWERTEEGPNKQTFHSPQELSHLLWQRLGGLGNENKVKKYDGELKDQLIHNISKNPEILFKDIDNGVPAIVLDGVEDVAGDQPKKVIQKTSMPPSF